MIGFEKGLQSVKNWQFKTYPQTKKPNQNVAKYSPKKSFLKIFLLKKEKKRESIDRIVFLFLFSPSYENSPKK